MILAFGKFALYLFQYDFKIEFFKGRSASDKPSLILVTNNGAPEISINISNNYSGFSTIKSKFAELVIFNLPMDFNSKVEYCDTVKVYYKRFSYETKFTLIFGGNLSIPMDTDYDNGDFSIDLKVELAGGTDFFHKPLKITNFQNMTVEKAIISVFPDNSIIELTTKEANTVITSQFTAKTPSEFVDKLLHSKYVLNITRDVGQLKEEIIGYYIFKGEKKQKEAKMFSELAKTPTSLSEKAYAKPLERYGLIFIPQQDIQYTTKFNKPIIFWNAQVLFTHKLLNGDLVSFVDRAGVTVYGTIDESNATLSNVSDCVLNLKIRDFVVLDLSC